MAQPRTDFKRYTITAALPYANGPLHLGHLAGAYIPADIYARYLRLCGKKTLFICGTDEHGAAISIRALKEGISPRELVDKYYAIIRKGFEDMRISFDVFSRTSLPVHHETAQEFFLKFHKENKLVEKTGEQLFDEKAGVFLADRYVTGTCPKCGNPSAYGDQCERCGSSLNPTDLIDPKSTITGSVPVLRPTRHWFFPLNDYQDVLSRFLEDHDYWKANVYGQCRSWLNEGLQPRAITRDLDWGVKVPLTEANGKVLYVWFDAPIGYISATKHLEQIRKAKGESFDWKEWWIKSEDTALIHFIGKDNIVFHCIIFPSMLMGHGEFNLPENVPANEFLNLEGQKLSTSRNWAVWVHEFVEDFPGKADLLRYVIAATLPEQKDNDFTWKDYQTRINSELVAVLGNFIRRVEVLSFNYYKGQVPNCTPSEAGAVILAEARALLKQSGASIEKFRFREALGFAMDIARLGNKYLADTEPWKLQKTDPAEVEKIMFCSLQLCAILSTAFHPFMPDSADKICRLLNISLPDWNQAQTDILVPAGTQLNEIGVMFEKVEDTVVDAQVAKLARSQVSQAPVPVVKSGKEAVSFDDFQKMDLRIGTILSAEAVPKSDKLLKLSVDTGLDTRTIVSGVALHFKPEELTGKQALVLVNLPPKVIRGVESQGMLLFAEDHDGKLRLMGPQNTVANGSTVA